MRTLQVRNNRSSWGKAMIAAAMALTAGLLSGCPGAQNAPNTNSSSAPSTSASPGGKLKLTFWHTRRRDQEALLKEICADYNRENPGVEVVPEYQGTYSDLGKKIGAAIRAKSLPAMSLAYESNVTEYMKNGVVRPLDDLANDPQVGLSKTDLADIPPQFLASNRYPQFKGQLLSFPFSKSVLVLYYNRALLAKSGFVAPPTTWPAFEKQASVISAQLKRPAFAFEADPSTLDGFVFSQGGGVLAKDGQHTLFDQPPTVAMLSLLQRMAQAKTLTEVSGDDAAGLFSGQLCAFVFSSTSALSATEKAVEKKFDWDVAVIPHGEGAPAATVLYGPNICIFRSNAQQEKEAWKFMKYFASTPVTARWARGTGYEPVRKSAVELPEMRKFYQQNPRFQHGYEALKVAGVEPNASGWQEVRDELQRTASAVVSGTAPAPAAVELKKKADSILEGSK